MNTAASRILLIDDHTENRSELHHCMEKHGHVVTTASIGPDALNLVRSQEFDLVLIAIEMAEAGALDVLKGIRQGFTQVELPVIIITTSTDGKAIGRAFDLGANDNITRPIDYAVASARVRTQLSLKRMDAARRESEERYALALEGSKDGIWDWDLKAGQIYFSARWKSMLGYKEDEIGCGIEEWFDRIHPDDRPRVERDMANHIDGALPHFENEHRIMHRDGSYLWILTRGIAVRNQLGAAYRIAGSQTDVTASKTSDPLTGLPNRTLFTDRLSRLTERAKRKKGPLFGILFIDIDRFKHINDSLGHVIGDQLLVAFARRMEFELRSIDAITRLTSGHTFARLGGDEFTVLLDDLRTGDDAMRVAERLSEMLKRPFSIASQEITITASIGVSLSSTGYEQPEDLLQDADIAMYRAKAAKRGNVKLFDLQMRASAVARLHLENELRHAVEHREFHNWYQLIVNLTTGRSCGFEALVRWRHPSRGWVTPDKFIVVAEETGIIIPLGRQVLREACRQLHLWHQIYPTLGHLTVAINVSSKHLLQGNLVSEVQEALEESGIVPACLKLDITESMVISNPEQARITLNKLKALGVRIGMDDFGTGYSSLSYLHDFPIDTLKIDHSFVQEIETNSDKLEAVKTIIALANKLKLEVVAEGIETPSQMHLLKKLGCESGQGYLFSRPLDAAASTDLLAAHNVWRVEGLD